MSADRWDREHGDQRVFNQVPGYMNWLNKHVPCLTSIVQMEPLWVHLIAMEAVDRGKRSKMELNTTNEQQVQQLCDHLQVGAMWRWHAFLRSLVLTDQEAVFTTMEIDPKPYKDQIPAGLPPGTNHPLETNVASPSEGTSTSTSTVTQQKITEETLEDFMTMKRAALMTKLRPYMGPQLLTDFLSGEAITSRERDLIKNETHVDGQLEKLLDFISSGDIEKFDNFCTAMLNQKMTFINRLIKDYFSQIGK